MYTSIVERIFFPLEPKGLTRITSVAYFTQGDCVCTQLGRDTTVFYVSSPLPSCVRVCYPLRSDIQMAHEMRTW